MKISSRGTSGGGDPGADTSLVAVGGGGVEVAVAGREGILDRALGLLRRHLEDAEAELRDLDPVAEPDVRDACHSAQLDARPMAISGKASMKPMNRPIAAPHANVMVFERAPYMALMKATRRPHRTRSRRWKASSRHPTGPISREESTKGQGSSHR